MYSSDNGAEVLRCPYNKYHTVPRSRFQRHLVKCEKVTILSITFMLFLYVEAHINIKFYKILIELSAGL